MHRYQLHEEFFPEIQYDIYAVQLNVSFLPDVLVSLQRGMN